eukprot:125857_1
MASIVLALFLFIAIDCSTGTIGYYATKQILGNKLATFIQNNRLCKDKVPDTYASNHRNNHDLAQNFIFKELRAKLLDKDTKLNDHKFLVRYPVKVRYIDPLDSKNTPQSIYILLRVGMSYSNQIIFSIVIPLINHLKPTPETKDCDIYSTLLEKQPLPFTAQSKDYMFLFTHYSEENDQYSAIVHGFPFTDKVGISPWYHEMDPINLSFAALRVINFLMKQVGIGMCEFNLNKEGVPHCPSGLWDTIKTAGNLLLGKREECVASLLAFEQAGYICVAPKNFPVRMVQFEIQREDKRFDKQYYEKVAGEMRKPLPLPHAKKEYDDEYLYMDYDDMESLESKLIQQELRLLNRV